MDRQVTKSRNPARSRTLACGVLAILSGAVCIITANIFFPPTVDFFEKQSRWGHGYRFDFEVVDGRCVLIEHTGKPFEQGVGAVYSVGNFATPIFRGPPFLDWLWKPRFVGLNVQTRQTIVWPEQAGEPLPPDLSEQLGVLVEAAIASGHDSFWVLEGSREELAREMCLPVKVTATSGEVHIPRPGLSHPVPRARLAGVTISTLVGVTLFAIGASLIARFIYKAVRTSRNARVGLCPGCAYQMADLGICPECGRSREARI